VRCPWLQRRGMPLQRNNYALMVSSALTAILGLGYWILAARRYPAEEVGRGSATIATMTLLSTVALLNVPGALTRYIPRGRSLTGRLVVSAYVLTGAIASVGSLVFMLGVSVWAPRFGFLRSSVAMGAWFCAATVVWCIFSLQDCLLTGLRRTVWVPVENATFGAAKIRLLFALATVAPGAGIFASWTMPMAALLVPVNLLIFRMLIPRPVRASPRRTEPIRYREVGTFLAGDSAGTMNERCGASRPGASTTAAGSSRCEMAGECSRRLCGSASGPAISRRSAAIGRRRSWLAALLRQRPLERMARTASRTRAAWTRPSAVPWVCIVGPGTRFLSGITYYTFGLVSELAKARPAVSVVLLGRLLPRRLYPGAARVGQRLSDLTLPGGIDCLPGLDWYWIPSMFRALWFLRRRRDVVVLQWWTAAVLHTYLLLGVATRLLGGRLMIEFHEVLDTGEDRLGWVRRYVRLVAPVLFRLADRYVVHSEFERQLVASHYGLPLDRIETIPHAAYTHYRRGGRWRPAPDRCCNLLFFGVIRPFKGLEDLIRAFNAIPADQVDRYWLTVVGETWEGWDVPGELIAASPHRARITFINRYVTDEEADRIFGGADVVVLPYHRSSQSGPLQIAMHYGLPVVVSAVGGLVEAVQGYAGAFLCSPADPASLLAGIQRAVGQQRGRRFTPVNGWAQTAEAYGRLLDGVARRGSSPQAE
jgi:glycosyltransferase involved in cell wall biosynthesis